MHDLLLEEGDLLDLAKEQDLLHPRINGRDQPHEASVPPVDEPDDVVSADLQHEQVLVIVQGSRLVEGLKVIIVQRQIKDLF